MSINTLFYFWTLRNSAFKVNTPFVGVVPVIKFKVYALFYCILYYSRWLSFQICSHSSIDKADMKCKKSQGIHRTRLKTDDKKCHFWLIYPVNLHRFNINTIFYVIKMCENQINTFTIKEYSGEMEGLKSLELV